MKLGAPRRSGMTVRAGLLSCICDGLSGPPPANDNMGPGPGTFALTAGFAFAVLGQTAASATLPLAGAMLAPRAELVTWPFAALMLGAVLASFPASFLRDAFGRRAGFALGASLGIAGGLLLAIGLLQRQFAFACIGGLWLGMAQGFSFFYRHEAAASSAKPGAAAAGVLAGGLLAALAGPALMAGAEQLLAPFFLVGAALLAALAHTAALAVAVRLAPDPVSAAPRATAAPLRTLIAPTLAAAGVWFSMTLLMGGAPLKLVNCGIGEGAVFGFVALHVFAMYAPAVPLVWIGARVSPRLLSAGGLALSTLALWLAMASMRPEAIALALILSGAGWSAATIGATAWLRERGAQGRLGLALHDGTLFLAALGGAQLAMVL